MMPVAAATHLARHSALLLAQSQSVSHALAQQNAWNNAIPDVGAAQRLALQEFYGLSGLQNAAPVASERTNANGLTYRQWIRAVRARDSMVAASGIPLPERELEVRLAEAQEWKDMGY